MSATDLDHRRHEAHEPHERHAAHEAHAAHAAHEPHEPLRYEPFPRLRPATVEIVIPVYDEEGDLAPSVQRLHAYLSTSMPWSWAITIADNASTDATWSIACSLAQRLEGVRAVHLDAKGRGRALRAVWSRSESPVVAYMDVDLSTDLAAVLPLIAPLVSGHSDLAIGTRLAPTAQVARGAKREAISRTYNWILRTTLRAGFSDAQCGFKAARNEALRALLPHVRDEAWFFDTELLVLAERNGFRIHEVPVDWVDDADSRVHVAATARADLAGIARLMAAFALGKDAVVAPSLARRRHLVRPLGERLVRFGSIGVVSSVVFAAVVALLASPLGVLPAAVVSLALCTLANTAANRRMTFAMTGRGNRLRQHVRALAVGLVPLVTTFSALGLLAWADVRSLGAIVAVLTVINAAVGVARFVLVDRWVFRAAS
jgi:putative flippase GtrA